MIRCHSRRLLVLVAVVCSVTIYIIGSRSSRLPFALIHPSPSQPDAQAEAPARPVDPAASDEGEFLADGNGPRIRQATMLYEGDNDHMRATYLRCISTYKKYGKRWGFPTHILEHGLIGDASFFNKPAYVMSLMMNELAKPQEKRAQWIVWFDGDSIVMNPAIPWTIFLPPDDINDVHVLGTRDDNGFNAGMIIFRVHQWTVNRLSEALALRTFKPELHLPFADQSAMDYVFNRTENHDHFIYQPRHWWNRYFFTEDGREVGEFLVHFAGVGSAQDTAEKKTIEKQSTMVAYLDVALGPKEDNWERDVPSTRYDKETARYWNVVKQARTAVAEATVYLDAKKSKKGKTAVQKAQANLKQALTRPKAFEMDLVDNWEELSGLLETALKAT